MFIDKFFKIDKVIFYPILIIISENFIEITCENFIKIMCENSNEYLNSTPEKIFKYSHKEKKYQLHQYAIFIASRWFKTIDDFINLEISSPRFLGNLTKFFYNPIPITPTTRKLFPCLRTLYLYNKKGCLFENDENIIERLECKIQRYDLFSQQYRIIQQWTNKKIDKVIFDSNVDLWDVHNSTFVNKVFNKSNLVFIIKDDIGNKFGYYLNSTLDKIEKSMSTSMQSFMFSLEHNHDSSYPKKFELRFKFNNCYLYSNESSRLIDIGDICLKKKSFKDSSYCDLDNWNFNYHCGKYLFGSNKSTFNFNPNHLLVIQMK